MTIVAEDVTSEKSEPRAEGRVVAIAGPVVDVEFPPDTLPEINYAVEMQIDADVGVAAKEVGQDRPHPARSEGHRHREPDDAARAPRRLERDMLDVFRLGIDARGLAELSAIS